MSNSKLNEIRVDFLKRFSKLLKRHDSIFIDRVVIKVHERETPFRHRFEKVNYKPLLEFYIDFEDLLEGFKNATCTLLLIDWSGEKEGKSLHTKTCFEGDDFARNQKTIVIEHKEM